MNEKNQASSLSDGVNLNKIPYKLNQLPYKPTITLAVDKATQRIIDFSIQETPIAKNFQTHPCKLEATPINYVRNAIARHFAGHLSYFSIDNSPEFGSVLYVEIVKEISLQPKLASNNTLARRVEVDHILADVFVILSLRLRGHSRPSPKNPPFGELWRQRGHRLPRSYYR